MALDALVSTIEAVVEHRRMLVTVRTLVRVTTSRTKISKLPVEIRDQIVTTGKIEGRLRQLERIDTSTVSTERPGIRRLERELDEHGTVLRDQPLLDDWPHRSPDLRLSTVRTAIP